MLKAGTRNALIVTAFSKSKPTPGLGPGYGQHIAGRFKECLGKLIEEGKLEGDEVVKY